jgi:preprotein translocase subunit SecY
MFKSKAIRSLTTNFFRMKFFETIRNIWKIEDLKSRITTTLGLLLIYRLGSFVVIPGIDPNQLANLESQTREGVLGLLDMFSGGAFSNASIFALGIMPYISASIVIQLMGIAIPYFQRLQREGESGRRRINQITRYLTVVILLFQAPGYIANLHSQLPDSAFATSGWGFSITATIILTAGSMFVMWLGERITDKGIGNGISLIIMIGIIARLPFAMIAEFVSRLEESGGLVMLLIEFVVLFFVFAGTILLVQGTRRVPVQYAKRIVGNKQFGGVRQYIPLKVNAAGVMPIIFAQAIMFIPITFAGFVDNETATGFASVFANFTGFWYNFIFGLMIIVFTYFYTAITVNPQQMAEDMKRNGGFIPGVKPGKRTMEFLDSVMSKITLPGSIFLALVAILPAFATMAGVDRTFAQFYGGTSLLILVGVVLDTLQQIESHLLMRHYDGLMKSGRIKGRTGGGAAMY